MTKRIAQRIVPLRIRAIGQDLSKPLRHFAGDGVRK
jgi:hypothetical protein